MKDANIFVATPSYDDKVYRLYLNSIVEYITKTNINISYYILPNDSLITRMRNSIFTNFYENIDKNGYTHILWQDSDIYMSAEGLERLVNFDVDMIGPAVPLRLSNKIFGISCAVSGVYEDLGNYLYKAQYLGCGVMMMSSKLVKKIVEFCEINNYWYWDFELNKKIYDVFKVGVDRAKNYQSEDWYVCETVDRLGFDIYVDSGSFISHRYYDKPPVPINPQSINRKYSSSLLESEYESFWTPNDWKATQVPIDVHSNG